MHYQQDDGQYMDGGEHPQILQNHATEKLVSSRQNRKKAEEDVKLLANRIALLKKEEQKAWKKIEDTKKKASDIITMKQRNQEQTSMKQHNQIERDEQIRFQRQKTEQIKQQLKEGVKMQMETHKNKLREDADRLKAEKQEQKEYIQMVKQQETMKNAQMRQLIKNSENDVLDRKQREQMEKKLKIRQELQQKIMDENAKRIAIESEVSRLEQEELKLIQNLQNTQLLQRQAYDDLEGALSGGMQEGGQRSQDQMEQYGDQKTTTTPGKLGSEQKGRPQTSDKRTPQNAMGR